MVQAKSLKVGDRVKWYGAAVKVTFTRTLDDGFVEVNLLEETPDGDEEHFDEFEPDRELEKL